ncbi:hypothetical protein QUC31_008512 [Theobroma cacao]
MFINVPISFLHMNLTWNKDECCFRGISMFQNGTVFGLYAQFLNAMGLGLETRTRISFGRKPLVDWAKPKEGGKKEIGKGLRDSSATITYDIISIGTDTVIIPPVNIVGDVAK